MKLQRLLMIAGFLASVPMLATAQTPGADEASTDAAIAQDLSNTPAIGKWQWTGNFGFQFQGGQNESLGINLDLIIAHATKRFALLRLDGEINRSEYRPAPHESRIISDDDRTLMLTFLPRVKGRIAPILILSSKHDKPAGLVHRTMWQTGPYIQLVRAKAVSLGVSLLAGSALQDNAITSGTTHVPVYGSMQSFIWRMAKSTTFQAFGAEHRNARDPDDYGIYISSSVTDNVTSTLGLNFYHKYAFEAVHPDGVGAVQQSVGFGIQLNVQ